MAKKLYTNAINTVRPEPVEGRITKKPDQNKKPQGGAIMLKARLAVAAALITACTAVHAQTYPTRAIRFIIPQSAAPPLTPSHE